MLAEEIRVGYHLSTKEKVFADYVLGEIRQVGYRGKIEVVGSRLTGNRFSEKVRGVFFYENERWWNVINRIARKNDLCAGEVNRVVDYLPSYTPKWVIEFFRIKHILHLDADLDLLLCDDFPVGLDSYCDKNPPLGSGLVVDIFRPGEYESCTIYDY